MTPDLRQDIVILEDALDDAIAEITTAMGEEAGPDDMVCARSSAQAVLVLYRSLLSRLAEPDLTAVGRTLGQRIREMQGRLAELR